MATALQPPPAATGHDAELEQHLGLAVRRIRINDAFAGLLLLVAIILGYTAAMIAIDRWVDVPAWARQAGLVSLAATLAIVGYIALFLPLRRIVNPLFAAKQVEETVPDAKNGIVNYVDLRDEQLPDSIRYAAGAKAVKQLQAADLNEAFDSRRLLWTGLTVAGLVMALALLFLLFRPAQFVSLLGRTLNPFSAGTIATRTAITITEPASGDLTVTAGQPVTIAVAIGGRVPDPNNPDRLRVLLRHNPADPNAEEVPLEPADSNREWRVRIPDHLVQNGFWYTVAGGDAVTAEHRVQVRSRPLFTAFETRYEYPEYLRLRPEVVREPQLEAYRGTTVTLTARANRELKSGRMIVAGQPQPILGEVVGDQRDALRFRLTLTESGTYRLYFLAATGEENADAPPYPIKVISDQPPSISILAPTEDEITLSANGTLAIDARVGDDFGIDTVSLQLRLADGGGRTIRPKPFQNGASFKRATDGTYPTSLEYKDSISLAELKDEPGKPVVLAEGMLLEYWLEATDNCGVPQPNRGKSKIQRVRIAAPQVEPMKQAEQKKQADQRKQDEQKHQQGQNQKFQNEQRDPPPQPRPEATEKQPETTPPPRPENTEPKTGNQTPQPDPMNPDRGNPKPTEPPMGGNETKPDTTTGDPKPPQSKPMTGTDAQPNPKGTPNTPSPNTTPEQERKNLEQEAQKIDQAIKQQQQQPAQGRSADEKRPEPAQPPAERKTPPEQGTEQPNEPKPGENAGQPGAQQPGAAQSKPPGAMPETPKPSEPKPDQSVQPETGNPNTPNKSDPEMKQQPLGGTAGTDKPAQKDPKTGSTPQTKDPMNTPPQPAAKPNEPGNARNAAGTVEPEKKPATPDAQNEPSNTPPKTGAQPEANPAAAKPAGKQERADARPSADPNQSTEPNAGEAPPATARGEKPPPAAERKDAQSNANRDPMATPPSEAKATPEKTPMGGGADNAASAKPTEPKAGKEPDKATAKAGDPAPPVGGTNQASQQKPDPKALQQAVNDLASDDPKKQQAAREKLDQMVGKQARQDAEQLMKDLKSDDPAKKAAAEQKLEQARNQANKQAGNQPPREPTAEEKKQLADAANDLTSDDPKKQQAAREKLDQMVGKDAREKAEQFAKDLKSDDPATKAAAQKKLEDLQKQAGNQPQREPTAEEKKQIAEAANDLTSDDSKKQQAARDKLDQMVGKDAREKAEQLAKDLKSDDPAKQAAAQKQLEDLQKQAKAQQPKKELTEAEKKQLAEIAKDMAKPDPAAKKAADEKFSETDLAKDLSKGLQDKMQKMNEAAKNGDTKTAMKTQQELMRDAMEMQKQLDDLKSGDPAKAEQAMKNLNDLAQQMKQDHPLDINPPPPGPPASTAGNTNDATGRGGPANTNDKSSKPLAGNEDYGKLPSELQLVDFKKNKNNKELLKQLGYTEQDYERFLKGWEEVVQQEKKARDEAAKLAPKSTTDAPRVNVGETTSKLEHRGDGSKTSPNASGTATAPPAYSEALKRFQSLKGNKASEKEEKK